MSITYYGLRFRCDLCGAEADGAPLASDQVPDVFKQPPPDGWSFTGQYGMTFRDAFGTVIMHLCPACSALSIGQIVGKLTKGLGKNDGD